MASCCLAALQPSRGRLREGRQREAAHTPPAQGELGPLQAAGRGPCVRKGTKQLPHSDRPAEAAASTVSSRACLTAAFSEFMLLLGSENPVTRKAWERKAPHKILKRPITLQERLIDLLKSSNRPSSLQEFMRVGHRAPGSR